MVSDRAHNEFCNVTLVERRCITGLVWPRESQMGTSSTAAAATVSCLLEFDRIVLLKYLIILQDSLLKGSHGDREVLEAPVLEVSHSSYAPCVPLPVPPTGEILSLPLADKCIITPSFSRFP